MPYTRVILAAAALALMSTVPALAQQKIYAYTGTHNFCPTGLQPVTMNGEICCGQPNQDISYQQVMAQGKVHRTHLRASASANCPVGTKGCTFD